MRHSGRVDRDEDIIKVWGLLNPPGINHRETKERAFDIFDQLAFQLLSGELRRTILRVHLVQKPGREIGGIPPAGPARFHAIKAAESDKEKNEMAGFFRRGETKHQVQPKFQQARNQSKL